MESLNRIYIYIYLKKTEENKNNCDESYIAKEKKGENKIKRNMQTLNKCKDILFQFNEYKPHENNH